MHDCDKCVHFSVCSRLGGIDTEDCSDYLECQQSQQSLVLPCEIGQSLYYYNKYTHKIEEDQVKYFTITKNGVKPIMQRHNTKFWDYYELGTNVFLSYKEVEAALCKECTK